MIIATPESAASLIFKYKKPNFQSNSKKIDWPTMLTRVPSIDFFESKIKMKYIKKKRLENEI